MLLHHRFLSRASYRWSRTLVHIRAKASTPKTFIPSPEQLRIVEACAHSNVWVSARPGSGKTTTVKAILEDNPSIPMIHITYSKQLQLKHQTPLNPTASPMCTLFIGEQFINLIPRIA
ncbi:hypothetical protein CPB86DRAFT_188401 [Serendipita vermifera]|nr:hypothetical protein CPB86DRAFT_188401 [Serendipita vermifera]